jgi:hypothetical protein
MFLKRNNARKGPDPRKAMDAVRVRWTKNVPSDFTDPGTCLAFCDRSYRDLKEYMESYLETPTMGLTADEMREEMQRLGTSPDLTQRVTKVVETCETLRYAPGAVALSSDAARALAEDMRQILSSTK